MYVRSGSSGWQINGYGGNKGYRHLFVQPTAYPHYKNHQNAQGQWFPGYEKVVALSRAVHLIKEKNSTARRSMLGDQNIIHVGMEKEIAVISAPFLNPNEVKNVLVVKLDHLGDIFLARPAITRLRERLREATIWVLCGSWSADLVRGFDSVDHVITLDLFTAASEEGISVKSDREKLQLQRKLSSLNLDISIDFRWDPETRWILGLSGAPLTIGYESYGYNPTISLPVDSTILNIYNRSCGKAHIINEMLALVDAIPILPPGSKDGVPAYRGVLSVGIHPGSGQKARCWPLGHFSQLIGSLLAAGFRVILFGGTRELEMNQRIIHDHLKNGTIIDMSGAVPIARYAETVADECNIYIGNNTGPTHMVAAAGVPVIAIYGGIVDPMRWFPPGHIVEVLTKAMPCMPCLIGDYRQCRYNLECITSVKPAQVFARVAGIAREVYGHEVAE